MNRFVRAQIRDALSLIKEKHNETFVKLLYAPGLGAGLVDL